VSAQCYEQSHHEQDSAALDQIALKASIDNPCRARYVLFRTVWSEDKPELTCERPMPPKHRREEVFVPENR